MIDAYLKLVAAFKDMARCHADALAMCNEWKEMYDRAIAERDAARAELARLKEGGK